MKTATRWGMWWLLALAAGSALAQEAKVHIIPDFLFEDGGQLSNMKVGYDTYGELNAARDNAILVLHGASQGRNGYKQFIGPGKAFDTDKYFVITVDAIGGGASSKPADGLGANFPRYSIRDMVRAQHHLLTKGLQLNKLLALGGPSMGSMQALEWGIHYPDFAKGLLLIVPSARSDRHVQSVFDAVIAAIQLDRRWVDGDYSENPVDGIVAAGMIYFPWLYSDEYLNSIADDAQFHQAERAFGTAWAKHWDARSLIYRYRATMAHDVSKPYGGDMRAALRRIKARTLVMPGATDRTLPVYMAREIQRGVADSKYVEIPSAQGHIACCSANEESEEYAFVSKQIREFLAGL